jgi:hypothetical protein
MARIDPITMTETLMNKNNSVRPQGNPKRWSMK